MAWIGGRLCCCVTSPVPVGSPRILDLGCGYGPIALAIALHCPEALIDAVDVNERALTLCRDNAVALGVADRVRVLRPEEVEPEVRTTRSGRTRPIRIGKRALHELLLSWLARLAPDGVASLVVGKQSRRRHTAALAASSRATPASGPPQPKGSGCS